MVTVTTWHLSFNSIAEHGDRLATLARGGCMCFMGDIVCAISRVPPHVAEGIVLHVGYSGEVRKGDSHLFIYWFSYPYSFCSLSILDFFDCFFFKFCFPQQHNFDVVMQNTSAISFSFFYVLRIYDRQTWREKGSCIMHMMGETVAVERGGVWLNSF